MRPPRSRRQQPQLAKRRAAGLVEIFGDDARAGHRRHALLDQDRRRAGRIELQKFLAPFPDPLLDQPRRQAVFFERQPHEAGMRTESDDGTASACAPSHARISTLRQKASAPRRLRRVRIELAGLAEAPEVSRHDRVDQFRDDAERLRACGLALAPRSETTLSVLSSSTWSGVIGGFGRNCRIHRLQLHPARTAPAPAGGGARWWRGRIPSVP